MGHIELSRSADLVVVAPATADLIAKLAARPGQRPRQHAAARHRQAGAARAGDERADVAAPGDPAQPRALCAPTARWSSAPTRARWPAASSGRAGWPSRRRSSPRSTRRSAAGRSPAGTCSSPPGRRTSRSTRCATSPTARPAGRAPRSPRRWRARGARVTFVTGPAEAPRPARRRPSSRSRPRAEMLAAVEAALPADAAVFAAAVADWRVIDGRGSQGEEGRPGARRRRWRSPRTPTSCAPSPAAARAGRGWSSASPPRPTTWSRTPPPSGCARAPTGSSPTTCSPATGIMGGAENAVTLITADGRRDLAADVQGGDRRARSPTASPRRWRDRSPVARPAPARARPGAAAAGLRDRGRGRHGRLRLPRAGATRRRADARARARGRWCRPGSRSRSRPATRCRCGRARGWRCGTG